MAGLPPVTDAARHVLVVLGVGIAVGAFAGVVLAPCLAASASLRRRPGRGPRMAASLLPALVLAVPLIPIARGLTAGSWISAQWWATPLAGGFVVAGVAGLAIAWSLAWRWREGSASAWRVIALAAVVVVAV
ncbi:MAG: hypothetical protein CMJ18_15120, partial [Phycisphaeraceae bacterium]|nr:hypothetical protein [Phycisphaeraceae bacterium]